MTQLVVPDGGSLLLFCRQDLRRWGKVRIKKMKGAGGWGLGWDGVLAKTEQDNHEDFIPSRHPTICVWTKQHQVDGPTECPPAWCMPFHLAFSKWGHQTSNSPSPKSCYQVIQQHTRTLTALAVNSGILTNENTGKLHHYIHVHTHTHTHKGLYYYNWYQIV
jgi:hypothetical protein